jgi:hypothetical protein
VKGERCVRQRQQPQQEIKRRNRDQLRVKIPRDCFKQLDHIKNDLNLRYRGRAVGWLLPHNLKGLVDLTKQMGFDNGGQTIEWLSTMGMGSERILNLKQELDSQNGGQPVNLSLPSDTRPLVELTRELGFNKGGETVDWLLEMATNPMLELMKLLGFKDGAKTIEWLLNQAQSSNTAVGMNRLNPYERPTLSSAMNVPPQFSPKQLKTPGFQPPGKRAQLHNFNAQPHNQFQSSHGQRFAEKQQQVRNTGQQNDFSRQFPDPKAVFNNYFANQNLFENIHHQNQFENIHAQNQNQFVNIDEQNRNQNQFVNIRDQNPNQFVNIPLQNPNQFVNIPEQNPNQFVNIPDQNPNQFIHIREHNPKQILGLF